MSIEADPGIRPSGDADLKHITGELTDPVLIELAGELTLGAEHFTDRVSALVDSMTLPDIKSPIVDQTTVNELFDEFFDHGGEKTKLVKAAKSFRDLIKPTKRKDVAHKTILHGSIISLLHTSDIVTRDRGWKRSYDSMNDKQIGKTVELLEIWSGLGDIPDMEANDVIGKIQQDIVIPIDDVLKRFPKGLSQDDYFEELKRRASIGEKIDPATDLLPLKFILATGIVLAFGKEPIVDAYAKSKQKTLQKIMASPYGTPYIATDFLENVIHDTGLAQQLIAELRDLHGKGRLLRLESREFRKQIEHIWSLANIYRSLENLDHIGTKLPSMTKSLHFDIDSRNQRKAEEISIGAINLFADNFTKMADHVNQVLGSCNDEDSVSATWDEAKLYDIVRTETVGKVIDALEGTGIHIDPALWEKLTNKRLNAVESAFEQNQTHKALQLLRSEIELRLNQVNTIDQKYSLTNTQLRLRDPRIINLAKVLSESIRGHEPLPIEATRSLVGLMLGVYRENSGEPVEFESLITEYLADADGLRQLSLELDFLGKPRQSRLLGMINLLDELIDSGTFDHTADHPELQTFEDFLAYYIELTTPAPEPEIGVTINAPGETADEPPTPVTPIPVETLAQADYEDIRVFPPGASEKDIITDFVRTAGDIDMPRIEWERIRRLIDLRNQFQSQNLQVEFMRTTHASWQVLPFFVLEVRLSGAENSVVVVESPVYGNATYIYRESRERAPWREVVQQTRGEARELHGAVPMVHVDSTRMENHFVKIWNRVISELTIRQ